VPISVLYGSSEQRGKQPTGRGPEGRVENGSAASLLVSHVSIKICSFLTPRRRPILNATKLKGLGDSTLALDKLQLLICIARLLTKHAVDGGPLRWLLNHWLDVYENPIGRCPELSRFSL
jgi:hypothetical protein